MTLKRLALAGLVPLAALPLAGYALAGSSSSDVAAARQATLQYHDVEAADDGGYTFRLPQDAAHGMKTCVSEPGEGAMGVHFVNTSLLALPLDPARPEVLVYEPRGGELKLVAVEYVVFQADWEAAGNTAPPSMFGRVFDHVTAPNRYGLPAFYALHAWLWKGNQSGLFNAWNPNVRCDGS